MSDFKAIVHEIQFPLGLCPRPRWASLQRSSLRHLAVFKGPTSKGRGGEGEIGGREGGKGRGGEEGRKGRERKIEFPHLFNPTLTTAYSEMF